jgi:hypothetical protein
MRIFLFSMDVSALNGYRGIKMLSRIFHSKHPDKGDWIPREFSDLQTAGGCLADLVDFMAPLHAFWLGRRSGPVSLWPHWLLLLILLLCHTHWTSMAFLYYGF